MSIISRAIYYIIGLEFIEHLAKVLRVAKLYYWFTDLYSACRECIFVHTASFLGLNIFSRIFVSFLVAVEAAVVNVAHFLLSLLVMNVGICILFFAIHHSSLLLVVGILASVFGAFAVMIGTRWFRMRFSDQFLRGVAVNWLRLPLTPFVAAKKSLYNWPRYFYGCVEGDSKLFRGIVFWAMGGLAVFSLITRLLKNVAGASSFLGKTRDTFLNFQTTWYEFLQNSADGFFSHLLDAAQMFAAFNIYSLVFVHTEAKSLDLIFTKIDFTGKYLYIEQTLTLVSSLALLGIVTIFAARLIKGVLSPNILATIEAKNNFLTSLLFSPFSVPADLFSYAYSKLQQARWSNPNLAVNRMKKTGRNLRQKFDLTWYNTKGMNSQKIHDFNNLFEQFCAELYSLNSSPSTKVTLNGTQLAQQNGHQGPGDGGVDIFVESDQTFTVVSCKRKGLNKKSFIYKIGREEVKSISAEVTRFQKKLIENNDSRRVEGHIISNGRATAGAVEAAKELGIKIIFYEEFLSKAVKQQRRVAIFGMPLASPSLPLAPLAPHATTPQARVIQPELAQMSQEQLRSDAATPHLRLV